ncbi:MAG: GNAT family N-acetyltransferase [Burkholderiales bacterium]
MTVESVGLRQASQADADFIYRLVEVTMRSYVERIWASFSIVQCGDEDVGAISVERHAEFIQLSQLYILPQHQNKGIGTSLVRELASEARNSRRPLRLRVLKSNPARRLYERLGFQVSSVTPERAYMELTI